jgi:hypothetical protein
MHLVVATVLVADGELLELTCHMVGGTGINIPIGIDPIGGQRGGGAFLGSAGEGNIESLEALDDCKPFFATELAKHSCA